MMVYIRSANTVSPQNTLDNTDFLTDPVEYNGTRLKAIEPNYASYIDAKLIRRMSYVIKMGVATAKQCLLDAQVDMPGAIITGTAFGCIEDTLSFLTRIIELNEEMLSPTAFIQSTHNTVAAQIALMLKCHNYNNTFVHKGVSFENALQDATMLLNEGETDTVLVGGIDELTDASFTVLTRLGLYKRWPVSNLSLYENPSKGTIGGEGAAFFLLSDKPSADNLAILNASKVIYKPENEAAMAKQIIAFLADNNLHIKDIDLLITGKNGDLKNDAVYASIQQALFERTPTAAYKHLCGEYPTSSSFALWLAANIIKKGVIPAVVATEKANETSPKTILIYNHYQNIYHSLMLVSAC
jgi:3-oxoacyl-[acyl-carrier-protein] synthase II